MEVREEQRPEERMEMGRWLEKLGKLAHPFLRLLEFLFLGESNPFWGSLCVLKLPGKAKAPRRTGAKPCGVPVWFCFGFIM